jgi:hypothetical protein
MTQGWACLDERCEYFGVVDEDVHALVGYGKLGEQKDIQRLKCQACEGTFSSRKGTPLYYVKSAAGQVEEVLWYLAEGTDISVLVRRTGRKEETMARWLNRMGEHSAHWHDELFRNLNLDLVQMDELYAKVRGTEETRWLWLAIDPVSKALPALHLGGRRSADAYALVYDLKHRLSRLVFRRLRPTDCGHTLTRLPRISDAGSGPQRRAKIIGRSMSACYMVNWSNAVISMTSWHMMAFDV